MPSLVWDKGNGASAPDDLPDGTYTLVFEMDRQTATTALTMLDRHDVWGRRYRVGDNYYTLDSGYLSTDAAGRHYLELVGAVEGFPLPLLIGAVAVMAGLGILYACLVRIERITSTPGARVDRPAGGRWPAGRVVSAAANHEGAGLMPQYEEGSPFCQDTAGLRIPERDRIGRITQGAPGPTYEDTGFRQNDVYRNLIVFPAPGVPLGPIDVQGNEFSLSASYPPVVAPLPCQVLICVSFNDYVPPPAFPLLAPFLLNSANVSRYMFSVLPPVVPQSSFDLTSQHFPTEVRNFRQLWIEQVDMTGGGILAYISLNIRSYR